MKDKDFKLLEDYIDNLLGLTQKKEIVDRLQNEPELLAQYNSIKKAKAIIAAEEELEIWDVIQEVEKERERDATPKNNFKTSFNKYWILAAVLAGLIIIGLTVLKKTSEVDKQMIAQDFTVKEKSIAVRGTNEFAEDSLLEANYIIPMKNVNDLIEKGEFLQARQNLKSIPTDFPLALQNVEYTLGLIFYLEKGRDNPEFHRILNKILDDPTHNCYKLAVKLDNEVNSIWGRIKE